MSSLNSRISPVMRASGTSSCIRLRARRNVDLPQPLGPMIAVTARARTSSVMFFNTCLPAKNTERSFTVRADRAGPVSASLSRGEILGPVRVVPAGLSWSVVIFRHSSATLADAIARQDARRHVDGGDQQQQHQRPRPGLAMPVVIRRDRVAENLERQRRD